MKFARYGVLIFFLISSIFIFPSFRIQANTKIIPGRYDWREHGYDFPVHDQGECNVGFTFAAIDAIQAAIWLKDLVRVDLSENNAKECNWHAQNYSPVDETCADQNIQMVTNHFTQKGLVMEACDPYVAYSDSCNETCPYQYRITEWQQFSPAYSIPAIGTIKQLLLDFGPLYSQMDPKISGFADYSEGVLVDGSSFDANKYTHGVLIVGWDDELVYTGGKGAWIVKNSFGTDWGNEGYFYLAYGNAGIGTSLATVTEWEKPSVFDNLHFYDEAGYTRDFLADDNNIFEGTSMALFKIGSEEAIQAVEIWTNDTAIVSYEIYENFNGRDLQNLLFQRNGIFIPYAGYHTLEVNMDFSATNEDEVAVIVNVQNQSRFAPITLDIKGPLSDNKTWFINEYGNWQSFASLSTLNFEGSIRLRTFRIPEGFNHRIYMPSIFKN